MGELESRLEERLAVLSINWADLARAANISDETMRRLKRGGTSSAATRRRVSAALGWQPDSIDRIAHGEEPLLAQQPGVVALSSKVAGRIEQLTDEQWARIVAQFDKEEGS